MTIRQVAADESARAAAEQHATAEAETARIAAEQTAAVTAAKIATAEKAAAEEAVRVAAEQYAAAEAEASRIAAEQEAAETAARIAAAEKQAAEEAALAAAEEKAAAELVAAGLAAEQQAAEAAAADRVVTAGANDANPFPDTGTARPAPRPPPARLPPLPAIAAELGLSRVDLAAYKHLWESAETANDRLPDGAALKFFTRSGLDAKKPGTLRTMWGIADTEPPKGSLNENEFFRACKLVAQAQAGQPMSTATFAGVIPLPAIEGIEQPDSNSEA